jgi:adenylate cyclase class IV
MTFAIAAGFSPLSQNLELKARCPDLARARQAAIDLGAVLHGILHQTDTYFRAANGRLKVRQIHEEPAGDGASTEQCVDRAELIWYDRPDDHQARTCNYKVVPIDRAPEVIAALTRALGLRGTVRKTRELHLWHNVRIHLDTVESLGTFIEFEAVITPAAENGPEASAGRLQKLRRALAIAEDDLISHSYSDLLKF